MGEKKTTHISICCEIKLNSYIYSQGVWGRQCRDSAGWEQVQCVSGFPDAGSRGRVLLGQPIYSRCFHQYERGSYTDKVTCLPLLLEAVVMPPPAHPQFPEGSVHWGHPSTNERKFPLTWELGGGQDHKATPPHIPRGPNIYFSTNNLRAPVF